MRQGGLRWTQGLILVFGCGGDAIVDRQPLAVRESPDLQWSFVCPADGAPIEASADFLGVGMKNSNIHLYPAGYCDPAEEICEGEPIYPIVAERLRDADVQWTVKQIPQQYVEPNDDDFRFKNHDALFGNWNEAGLDIIATLHGGAAWAADPENCPFPLEEPWSEYVTVVVSQYGAPGQGVIGDWETWNEPNLRSGCRVAPPGTYEAFAETHEAAYAAVKAADPSARVWGPGVFFVLGPANTTIEKGNVTGPSITFVREFIENASFDGLSIHTYFDDPADHYRVTAAVRELLTAANKRLVPLAVTEFNRRTQECDAPGAELRQARFLAEAYSCLANAGVDHAFWFTGTDWYASSGGCLGNVHPVGVLTTSATPKLAYDALDELGQHLNDLSF